MIGAPGFYAEHLGAGFATHDELLARLARPAAALAGRFDLFRGLALGLLARRGPGMALIRRERGTLPALAVCALPPARRRAFVLELVRRPPPASAWRRALGRLWGAAVEAPLLRRAAAGAQTMTGWEADEIATALGLDRGRVHHVPWALCETGTTPPAAISPGSRAVFASGRTACDWPTLFAAADGAAWELTVACSRRDLPEVRRLAGGAAEIRCEIPWDEHVATLRASAVYAIVLADRGLSAGHVRLMSAVENGAPVVASAVRPLEGYAVDGETALLAPPGDPERLRAAVDALLADPRRRAEIRDAALDRARSWTYADYFTRLRELIAPALGLAPGVHRSG